MSNSVVDADVAIGDQRLLAARRCNAARTRTHRARRW